MANAVRAEADDVFCEAEPADSLPLGRICIVLVCSAIGVMLLGDPFLHQNTFLLAPSYVLCWQQDDCGGTVNRVPDFPFLLSVRVI